VPHSEREKLSSALEDVGYTYYEEGANPVYAHFLK
jgi:hypothetical protein